MRDMAPAALYWPHCLKLAAFAAASTLSLALGGCDQTSRRGFSPSEYGVPASKRVVNVGEPVPRGGGTYRVGKPYQVRGKWYYPEDRAGYKARGTASWYGDDFHGRKTANGEIYNMYALSAAHPTLPMPSYARVKNLQNGRSVVVRINDRGPYHSDRVIDLSKRAANILGVKGLGNVEVSYLGRKAPLHGRDDAWLQAQVQENGQPMPATKVAALAPMPAWAMVDPERDNPVQVALADVLPEEQTTPPSRNADYNVASTEPVGAPSGEEIGIEALRQQQTSYASYATAPNSGTAFQVAAERPLSLVSQAEAAPVSSFSQIVQVGIYRDAAEAVRYRDALQQYGPAQIEMTKYQGVTLYQVKLGPFQDMAQAQNALSQAQAQGAVGAQLAGM